MRDETKPPEVSRKTMRSNESPQLPGWKKEETQMEALIASAATTDIFTLRYDSVLLFEL